jgi:hypothetical protein
VEAGVLAAVTVVAAGAAVAAPTATPPPPIAAAATRAMAVRPVRCVIFISAGSFSTLAEHS